MWWIFGFAIFIIIVIIISGVVSEGWSGFVTRDIEFLTVSIVGTNQNIVLKKSILRVLYFPVITITTTVEIDV